MKNPKSELIAVVRVRGKINLSSDIKKTFELLNLHNRNWCVLIENNKSLIGMVNRVKDYVTYGEISKDTLKELLKNRGEIVEEGKYVEIEKLESFVEHHEKTWKIATQLEGIRNNAEARCAKCGQATKGEEVAVTKRGIVHLRCLN